MKRPKTNGKPAGETSDKEAIDKIMEWMELTRHLLEDHEKRIKFLEGCRYGQLIHDLQKKFEVLDRGLKNAFDQMYEIDSKR